MRQPSYEMPTVVKSSQGASIKYSYRVVVVVVGIGKNNKNNFKRGCPCYVM